MNDHISRQAAVEAASRGCRELRGTFERVENELNAIPSADVVKVVRCRDCIHFLTPHGCGHIDGMVTAIDDGYCSYGERRTDGLQ